MDFFFFFFAKTMGKNIGKNISKHLSGKYSQKLHDHAKKSGTDALKTSSKRVIKKTVASTGGLIVNKIADKITKTFENSQQSNSEPVTKEHDQEIPKEIYISSEKRPEIIDELKLK